MIQAARAAIFYAMLITGTLSLVTSNLAFGALLLVVSWVWSQWVMRYSDHDALAALLFFLFVISLIGSFVMALVGGSGPYG